MIHSSRIKFQSAPRKSTEYVERHPELDTLEATLLMLECTNLKSHSIQDFIRKLRLSNKRKDNPTKYKLPE